ncbi:hypothetical protein bcgnr5390_17470 [Bacillus luti]|nr:hypothetical protein BC2903_61640 [Bacillus cereus]
MTGLFIFAFLCVSGVGYIGYRMLKVAITKKEERPLLMVWLLIIALYISFIVFCIIGMLQRMTMLEIITTTTISVLVGCIINLWILSKVEYPFESETTGFFMKLNQPTTNEDLIEGVDYSFHLFWVSKKTFAEHLFTGCVPLDEDDSEIDGESLLREAKQNGFSSNLAFFIDQSIKEFGETKESIENVLQRTLGDDFPDYFDRVSWKINENQTEYTVAVYTE